MPPRDMHPRAHASGHTCIRRTLTNIVLNHLDWQLHAAGFRHVRYADDFVVLCQNDQQAQEALKLVTRVLESELGLSLSPEKTKIVTFGKG